MRFRAHTGLVEQCQKAGVVYGIEADRVPEHSRVCFGLSSCATQTGRIFIFLFHATFFLKGYDFGVTLSRLRPGKAFKAAERISSSFEHTLLFASANKNPPTDGLELADIGTLPAAGAWLA